MAAVALAMALVACGGGGSDGQSSAGADATSAAKINLKASDLPTGWASAPHTTTADDSARTDQLAQCLGIPSPRSHQSADVHSPDFSKGQGMQLSSEVRFVKTEGDAKNDLAGFQSGKAPECVKQVLQKAAQAQLPQGSTLSDLRAEQLAFPTLRDGTAAFRVSLTVGLSGLNLPVYVDVIVFRATRSEVTMTALSTGSPFPDDLEKQLAKKMADRSK